MRTVSASFRKTVLCLIVLAGLGLGVVGPVVADKIVLKDGTVEESDRVWESQDYVHFILRGTRGVEIRYAKILVERIERKGRPSRQSVQPQAPKPDKKAAAPAEPPPGAAAEPTLTERELLALKKLQGIAFYDPRRSRRYWANAESHHTTLEGAVSVLAKQYGHSELWVLQHVGEENDLALIHENLLLGDRKPDKKSPTDSRPGTPVPKLAPQVEQKPAELSAVRAAQLTAPFDTAGGGAQFYDPRRPQKYWVSSEQRFHTLDEALAALAAHYKRSVAWVETHLGQSNDLADIHRNLEKGLAENGADK